MVLPQPRDGAEEPTNQSILSPRSGAGKRRRLLPTAGAVGYCLSPYGLCPTRKENVHTGLTLQDEVHRDRRGNFHGLAVQQRRFEDPLPHGVQRRTDQQRMPAQQDRKSTRLNS